MTIDARTAPLPATRISGGGPAPLPQGTSFSRLNMDDVSTPSTPPVGMQGSDASRATHQDRAKVAYGAMQKALLSDDNGTLHARTSTGDRRRTMVWGYSQLAAASLDRALITGDVSEARKALNGFQDYMQPDGSFNASHNGGRDRYYDDNAWTGLALTQGFRLTGDQRYIDAARSAFDFIMSGTDADGGVRWHEEKCPGDRPAASQGPALQLALQLYQLTGDTKYRDDALRLDAFMDKLRTGPNGMVIDKVVADGTGQHNDGTINAYNEGTAIGSDVQMYELARDGKLPDAQKHLDRAKQLASRTLDWFDDAKLYAHAPTFNAILVRNLLQLDRVLPDGDPLKSRIRPTIQRYLDHADSRSRTGDGWYRGNGLGKYNTDFPDNVTSVIDQSAFVQMHALMAMSDAQLQAVT